ncbi:urease accessory protein [Mesorhizobium ventifaucium]|uniref:Nickel/cobalt efflux system n=1 Tax=Mesorhizobium ventifaucium TaxID=666020 RepID=A0ABM9DWE2_9HYPH|nr:urease accessory protein [Mesorhizobium ventifaucium]CAH2400458.1 Nickel/cobalt efflux system [Mesorhizobium ventifaucium]
MTYIPILGLGFLLGMHHALDADHIAAVSSIAARRTRMTDILKHGLTWGLGHTLTLFLFAGAAIVLGRRIPDLLAEPLEAAVGVMLVALGTHVLWQLWREHLHLRRRNRCVRQIHPYSGAGDRVSNGSSEQRHEHGFRWRSLAVGLMHGMAGSAALLVLAVSQFADPLQGLAYIVLFGLGSMIGMGALSSVIAVPLVASARLLTGMNHSLQAAVALLTVGIGATTIYAILVHANV